MPTPAMSDTITDGIRVGAAASFLPDESDESNRVFTFGYNIVIVNNSESPAKLLRRHWVIIDAAGRREEVDGEGVVGQTPHLQPGEAFKYQSFARLRTQWGTMEGTYTMRRDDGSTFDVKIGRFYLTSQQLATVAGA